MALSLGAEGVSHLEAGQWEGSIAYRWLTADEGYIGDRVDPTYKSTVGGQIDIHSIDVQITHAFTRRFSATLTIPFVEALRPRQVRLAKHPGVFAPKEPRTEMVANCVPRTVSKNRGDAE